MKMKFASILLAFATMAITANAQVNGPAGIAGGKYEGAQKKGVAEGKGKVVGEDTFEGAFKKGLPEGKGVYIFGADRVVNEYPFAKGDKYEGEFKKGEFTGKAKITFADPEKGVLEGYFENAKYLGRTKDGYEVQTKDGIVRVVVKQNGTSFNNITVRGLQYFAQVGKANLEFEESGTTATYSDLKSEAFPFTVHLSGSAPSTGNKCELKVLIERPGTWQIDITTN